MLLYLSTVYLSFLLTFVKSHSRCPCEFPQRENGSFYESHQSRHLCVFFNESTEISAFFTKENEIIEYMNLSISIIKSNSITKYDPLCDVVVVLMNDVANRDSAERQDEKWKQATDCPGQCLPIPELDLPISIVAVWLFVIKGFIENVATVDHRKLIYALDTRVTCSLTIGAVFDSFLKSKPDDKDSLLKRSFQLGHFFRHVFWRRIAECREQKYWHQSIYTETPATQSGLQLSSIFIKHRNAEPYVNKNSISGSDSNQKLQPYILDKRPVHALIIWIGSISRFSLMKQQATVLKNELFDSHFKYKEFHEKFNLEENSSQIPGNEVEYVATWFASEVSYSCEVKTARCVGRGNR